MRVVRLRLNRLGLHLLVALIREILEGLWHLIEILVLIASELGLSPGHGGHLIIILRVTGSLHFGVIKAQIICNLLLVYKLVVLGAHLLVVESAHIHVDGVQGLDGLPCVTSLLGRDCYRRPLICCCY